MFSSDLPRAPGEDGEEGEDGDGYSEGSVTQKLGEDDPGATLRGLGLASSAGGFGPGGHLGSSAGGAGIPRAASAPLIPAGLPPQMSTWHAGDRSMSSSMHKSWRPLGATWRDWEHRSSAPVRRNADDAREYVSGCVPHWGKDGALRMKGVLEHELTWAYYRMRRHEKHPQRQAVGEFLPQDALNEKMRFGKGSQFQFWRDLRPPFSVLEVKRVDDGTSSNMEVPVHAVNHPDGELYSLTYECAIEYFAERLMDTKSDNGTFNNKVRGIAQVRIPNTFPQKRPIFIVSWGAPTLNPPDEGLQDPRKPKAVPPTQWMPIAGVLGIPPASERMAACINASNVATQRLEKRKKVVKVPELQRLLLGPHASLPRLAKMEALANAAPPDGGALTASSGALAAAARTATSPDAGLKKQTSATALFAAAAFKSASADAASTRKGPPPRGEATKVRKHTIFTPAVGFVSYAG